MTMPRPRPGRRDTEPDKNRLPADEYRDRDYGRCMRWITLISTIVGAAIATGSAVLLDRQRWRRERLERDTQSRRALYGNYPGSLSPEAGNQLQQRILHFGTEGAVVIAGTPVSDCATRCTRSCVQPA